MKTKIKSYLHSFFVQPPVFLALCVAFLEFVIHIVRFGIGGECLAYKLLFAAFYGIVVGTIIDLIPEKAARIVTIILLAVISIYYVAQLIYSGIFSTFLSISGTFKVAGQALDFTDVIGNELAREWWKLTFLLIPIVYMCVWGRKRIDFSRKTPFVLLGAILSAIAIYTLVFSLMFKGKNELYSAYTNFMHYSSVDMSMQKLGVAQTFMQDTVAGLKSAGGYKDSVCFVQENTSDSEEIEHTGKTEEIATSVETFAQLSEGLISKAEGIDTSPNVCDIDFDQLILEEKNDNIVKLHEYIESQTPTNKNEYTGMFEGYNLIFIVAEGFSGYSVDRNRTPELYKMIHNGFYFKNYYTPLWYGSTSGGEYADLTGIMPKNGGYLSMGKCGSKKNDMCFTLSRQLERQGYAVNGYHLNDYTYYDRNISHPNLGYNWEGVGNGLEAEYSESGVSLWPQSDVRLIDQTFDKYADLEPFHTYYLTVSGHVMYNFTGNAMAKKHEDIVSNLDYSETTRAYLACQYELELALEDLNAKLEEAGIADNTLIVLTADHVPYDNKEVEDELAGQTLDSTFEWYRNSLIIWSASMEEPVTVNKYCSSLDVLPTVSNLMGLEYDSRMLVGQDILSDSEGLVMFNDRSFITDRYSYNASTGQVKSMDGKKVSDEYVENEKVVVSNKFNMAQSICDYDYYSYIDPWKEKQSSKEKKDSK